jgi:release factor glutamine methyltransferase
MPLPLITAGITIASLLRKPGLDQIDARILLGHVLGLSRVQLITRSEYALNDEEARRVAQLFRRRADGEPIAYIIGEREFYGLSFRITPDVLIPRPETELLIELALERLPDHARVLDMGTGSGAIAITLAHLRPDLEVTALDASKQALDVARLNADEHKVNVKLICSDWYGMLGTASFELIVANPPYIMENDPHLSQGDLRFEPLDALTDHAGGLAAIRIIVMGASAHLASRGWLLLEHGYDQAEAVRHLLQDCGFEEVQSWNDLAGIARVSGGRLHP